MKNKDLRLLAMQNDVKLYQIAEQLNMTDSNFSRKLRHELPDDEKSKIREVIDKLAEQAV